MVLAETAAPTQQDGDTAAGDICSISAERLGDPG